MKSYNELKSDLIEAQKAFITKKFKKHQMGDWERHAKTHEYEIKKTDDYDGSHDKSWKALDHNGKTAGEFHVDKGGRIGHWGTPKGEAKYPPHLRIKKKIKEDVTESDILDILESSQLDEISKQTLGSYVKKASTDMARSAIRYGAEKVPDDSSKSPFKQMIKRGKGISRATDKLTKEDVTESTLYHDHEGKLKPLDKHTDLDGSLDYHKHMVDYHKPRKPNPSYHDKKDWYDAKDNLKNLKVAIKNKNKIVKEDVTEDDVLEILESSQLDELSKTTLKNYIIKAKSSHVKNVSNHADAEGLAKKTARDKLNKRATGINRAIDKYQKEDLDENVVTGNPGAGYHGDVDRSDKKYASTHKKIKTIAGEAGHLKDVSKPNVMIKHYLDSVHGRHLVGRESDSEYIKKDFGKFKKSYNPEHFKEGLDEGMVSYHDFQAKIAGHKRAGNQIANSKYTDKSASYEVIDHEGIKRKITHTDSGSKVENLGQVDNDGKPSDVKRGRGRPAGSKSGANN